MFSLIIFTSMFWPTLLLSIVVLLSGNTFAHAYDQIWIKDGHQCQVHVNGCSIPGDLPFFYKKKFTPACNKHDICYSCGQHYHWSRQSCDLSFQNDMYYLCELPTKKSYNLHEILEGVKKVLRAKEKASCRGIAYLYYKVVDLYGRYRYNSNSPGWCRDPCVETIGSPNRRIGVKVLLH